MSAPEQPDWIERLRRTPSRSSQGLKHNGVALQSDLWPLVCDVVEKADALGKQHFGLWSAVDTLRAEVERDA